MEKYKLTKTIRFKLLPDEIQEINRQVENLRNPPMKGSKKDNLLKLILKGRELSKLFKEYIQHKDNHKLKSNVTIHYRWLQSYTKDLFYNWKKDDTEKKIRISDVGYLLRVFADIFDDWENTIERINTDCHRPEESKTRNAEIALSIKKLGARHMFPALRDFVDTSNDKNTDEIKNKLLVLFGEFAAALETAEKDYLPSQSSGMEVARASFNYYTINKKQKDYTAEIDNIEKQLHSKYPLKKNDVQLLNELKKSDFIDLLLPDLYTKIKEYKSTEKSKFLESVSNGLVFGDLKSKFPLFEIESGKYDNFVELTEKITKKSTEKSRLSNDNPEAQDLQKDITKLKRDRGIYFKKAFMNYTKICGLYKDIAGKRGRSNARIKGMEKERIDSQRLQYWALVLEENNKHSLILIPKEKVKEAYKKIRYSQDDGKVSDSSLYYFESLTYRALRKLCFGINGNTFLTEIQKELPQYDQKDFGEFCFHKSDNDKEIDEPKLISFYQSVLKTNHVRNNLLLPEGVFDEVTAKPFATKQDFQIALEKCCYEKRQIISEKLKKDILQNYNAQIFKITSLDLQRTEQKNLKAHTQIWNRFWTKENTKQNYSIRLNPEISIIWRAAKETRMGKYGKGAKLYNPAMQNRYLHEQYTLCTTITENALNNEINFAFEDVKTKAAAVIKFNDKINLFLKKRLADNQLWFYGIDTGQIEFATLALMNQDKKPQLFTVYELIQLDFSRLGFIYNGDHQLVLRNKPYKAIQNLSYFVNQELYEKTFRDGKFQETFGKLFREKQVAAIDLTTAKVINNKIIINGDIITLLNLKILNAERKIYQELIANPQDELKEKNYELYFDIEGKDNKKKIYQSRLEFEYIKPYPEIKKYLFDYFAGQQKNEARVEDQINQTRRVLVGNMIGVIHFLYLKYPGVISIEDLDQLKIEADRKKFEGNIERPLEWALYRKFQQEGYVPPISELVKLREIEGYAQRINGKGNNESLKQFGIIKFVSEKDTSKNCPACSEKAYASDGDANYKTDKKEKVFHCQKCGFHNRNNPLEYGSLDSNDKIAAFNIAKRGLEGM